MSAIMNGMDYKVNSGALESILYRDSEVLIVNSGDI
jgi:hypothetical protein